MDVKTNRARRIIAATVTGVLVIGLMGSALAVSTTLTGRSITGVQFVSDTSAQQTSSTSFVDLAGASTTITVPSLTRALVLARFSAQSSCDGPGSTWCAARVVANTVEAAPAGGLSFHFDSADVSGGEGQARSMDRAITLGPGTYTIKVQVAVSDPTSVFRVSDWSLTLQRAKA